VDPNQELIGLGTANITTGFFQGFSISSSASRTPVAEGAGSRTQLTGVTGAAAIALLLVFAPSLLKNLPNTALAAVVIASAIGLFEIRDLRRLYNIQRWEFWLSIACFLGVAILGPIPGILFAIIIALLEFVWDGCAFCSAGAGGWGEGLPRYHRYGRLIRAAALKIGCPVFSLPTPNNSEQVQIVNDCYPVRWFVVAAEPVTSIDVTAADMLAELDDEMRQAGIQLAFAEMKDPVKDKLKRFGLSTRFDDRHFFATLGQAVSTYVDSSGIAWEDWEDRK
jgi:MFS superfamily sulfate permease-like transporter